MAPIFRPVEYYTSKLYEKGNSFKRFMELADSDLEELAKQAEEKRKIIIDNNSVKARHTTKFDIYQSALEFLTGPNIHLKYKTFDERIAMLIMMVDPELVLYKEYLKLNLMSKSDIDKVENIKERASLVRKRNQTILNFQSAIREKLGFYDPKLLRYEEIFFHKFFSDKELVTEVGNNNQDAVIFRAKVLKDFKGISDERFEQLKDIAQGCLAMVPDNYSSSLATYNVINQRKLLGLAGMAEQLALFVLLVDSNLDMLRIYEEESRMSEVEARIVEQFGYYNPELLNLEKKFHDRFCPDKKLSVWTITK